MNQYAERIARDFPARRKAKEKEMFRTWLVWELREMGYSVSLQSSESALQTRGSATNVVVGDPEQAKLILTAHYDTGVKELFPPLIAPTRPVTFTLYQALTPVLMLLVSFLLSFGITFALNEPFMTLPLFLIFLLAMLCYPKFGPDEMRNANDNGSGVAALLETAKNITPRYRGNVCFVFFDCGAQGMQGARGFRRKYPVTREKNVINLDCVGQGDELLLLPSKYSRWNGELLDLINESFAEVEMPEGKSVLLKTDGLVYYPSDNRKFRYSTAVCAVKKVSGFGRCITPHSDGGAIDEGNLRILSEGLAKLVMRCG